MLLVFKLLKMLKLF